MKSMDFLRGFALATLVIAAWVGLILSLVVVVVFLAPVDQSKVLRPGQSELSVFLLDHVRLFTVSCWAYAWVGVVASVGLLKKKPWAHTVWVVLLVLALLWVLAVILSETWSVFTPTAPSDHPEQTPRFELLWVVIIVPLCLMMSAVLVFLLRKLFSVRGKLVAGRTKG